MAKAKGKTKSGPKSKPARKKTVRSATSGVVHVQSTFNNIIISITDRQGNVIFWSSAGRAGFKGSRKSTAFAAQTVAQQVGSEARSIGMREVEVWVKGPGAGRESAIRSLQSLGMKITVIRDVTPVPHNGCRPPKRRRV